MTKYQDNNVGAFKSLACIALAFIGSILFLWLLVSLFLNEPISPIKIFSPKGMNMYGQNMQHNMMYNHKKPSMVYNHMKPLHQKIMPKEHSHVHLHQDEYAKKELIEEEFLSSSSLPHIKSNEEIEEEIVEENLEDDIDDKEESFWTALVKSILGKKIVYKEKKVFKIRGKGECKTCRLY